MKQNILSLLSLFKASVIAGLGGFIGTCLRFLTEKLGRIICHSAFPLGTFMANIVGCMLIGIFYGWLRKSGFIKERVALFLITGLCGSLTTFSSMSNELVALLRDGNDLTFWFYLAASLILGFVAVAIGIACVHNKSNSAIHPAK